MNCRRCGYEMIEKRKPASLLLDMAAVCKTWIYWRWFKCPECEWQYMAEADKVFNVEDAERVIGQEYEPL